MDSDDDLEACLEQELRIMDELEQEEEEFLAGETYASKRARSPGSSPDRLEQVKRQKRDSGTSKSISKHQNPPATAIRVKMKTNEEALSNQDITTTTSNFVETRRNVEAMPNETMTPTTSNFIEARKSEDRLALALQDKPKYPRKGKTTVKTSEQIASIRTQDAEVENLIEEANEIVVPPEVQPQQEVEPTESTLFSRQSDLDRLGGVATRIPLTGNYLPITAENGQRVYVTMDVETALGDGRLADVGYHGEAVARGQGRSGLMGEDFYSMLDTARAELRRQRDSAEKAALIEPEIIATGDKNQGQPGLWVDKYAPKSYTELLSEESINRTLLRWLKAWDPVTFGRPCPPAVTLPTSAGQHSGGGGSGWVPPSVLAEVEATRMDPSDGRPHYKVALLSGPPGLGKTTLAQILARHVGYQVLEMNASDDRSPEAFASRLDAAARSRGAVSGNDSGELRPICLIVDEVDGAPAPAVEVLVAAAKASLRGDKKTGSGKGAKGGRGGPQPLLRPVICICNNLYAPSLRNLRLQALVFRFPDPELSRLSTRLAQILRQEGMRADMTLLAGLADKAERDIRSCLNTLQFLRGRGVSELHRKDLEDAGWGQKDVYKGLFAAWQAVFAIPRPRHNITRSTATGAGSGLLTNQMTGGSGRPVEGSMAMRFQHVLETVQCAGEYEKVTQGIFENYLSMKSKDATMQNVVASTKWLTFQDLITQTISKQQNYTLMRYTSYLPVVFHFNFALSSTVPKLEWPHADTAAFLNRQRTEAVLDSLQASAWHGIGRIALIQEVFPALWHIVHPAGLKPMNTQLYSAREKAQLANTVAILLDSGLDFRQERTPEGQYVYCLDPDLEKLVCFPDVGQKQRGPGSGGDQLSYAAKQLVSRELALERMRRAEQALVRKIAPPSVPSTTSSIEATEAELQTISAVKQKQPTQQPQRAITVADQIRQLPKAIQPSKMSRDFFGRPIVEKLPNNMVKLTSNVDNTPDNNKNQSTKTPLNQSIWFRFKEGYSNAIRRPVKICDFI